MKQSVLCCVLFLAASSTSAQTPPNDTCAGAIELSCGPVGPIQTNTTAASNDYDQAAACTPYNSAGPDIVYRIVIPDGGSVSFQLDTTPPNGSGYDGSLYLITNCADPAATCLDGDDGTPPDFTENISYTNSTGLPEETFLIVDGFFGASAPDRGTGTLTGTVTCPTGVCCKPGVPCSVNTRLACEGAGGVYQGNGTNCSSDPCPPAGACCDDGGMEGCFVTTREDCGQLNGFSYMGDGTDCDPDPCALGACCVVLTQGGFCKGLVRESDCAGHGWMGPGTECADCPVAVQPATWGRIKHTYKD